MRISPISRKVSVSILSITALVLMLVYYSSDAYRRFADLQQTQTVQRLATLEAADLIQQLKTNSLDLALAIEHEKTFQRDFKNQDTQALTQQLDSQFYQYFVTAGVVKLLKLYILDTNFTLLSTSKEGIKTDMDGGLICAQLSQQALIRKGSEKLQTLSHSCLYNKQPVFAVIVPFGGLNPKGYIQVITQLPYNLQKMQQSLAMPIQMQLPNKQTIYQSDDWSQIQRNDDYLIVQLPIKNNYDKTLFVISLQSDMRDYNLAITGFRNGLMAFILLTAVLAFFLAALSPQNKPD